MEDKSRGRSPGVNERGSLFDTPSLFDQTFALGGFDPITGPALTLGASIAPPDGTSVPEPGSALVLLGALAAFRASARRQPRQDIREPAR